MTVPKEAINMNMQANPRKKINKITYKPLQI